PFKTGGRFTPARGNKFSPARPFLMRGAFLKMSSFADKLKTGILTIHADKISVSPMSFRLYLRKIVRKMLFLVAQMEDRGANVERGRRPTAKGQSKNPMDKPSFLCDRRGNRKARVKR